MSEPTLESLARRLEIVERQLNELIAGGTKNRRVVAGMFSGRVFSKRVDEEGRKIRAADRDEADREFGS